MGLDFDYNIFIWGCQLFALCLTVCDCQFGTGVIVVQVKALADTTERTDMVYFVHPKYCRKLFPGASQN
jgi:hypothetical protein